jgi:hypothetical protein
MIQRRYFAEPPAVVEQKSGTLPVDWILDTISNVPAATSSQQLSWRLTTVDKLDRLGSRGPSILWSALRKDNCRIHFDDDPSTGDWQELDFIDDIATNNSMAANPRSEIPVARLPSKSFMLFPRITGFFGPDYASSCILHAGSALPHDSPAFRGGSSRNEAHRVRDKGIQT